MLSARLLDEFNEQIKLELYSANIYLAMAGYLFDQNLDGFAKFFMVQAEEERQHALKFFNFINDKDGRIEIRAMDKPQNEYESVHAVFKTAHEHEQFVTRRIHLLMDIAVEEKNYSAMTFLQWFIEEQVEEEATMNSIVKKLEMIKDNISALLTLDNQLGNRTLE